MLQTQQNYTDRALTMKNLTGNNNWLFIFIGSQKRAYHGSIFNYPELNCKCINRLDNDFEERKELAFVMSMLKTKKNNAQLKIPK